METSDTAREIRPEARSAALRLAQAMRNEDLAAIDSLTLYERTVAEAQRVIDAVHSDQMHVPTPCTEWDVRAVINHMIGLNKAAVAYAAAAPLPDLAVDFAGDDPASAFAASARSAGEALRGEKPIPMPFGEAPGTLIAATRNRR